jgi:hypothetical protein
MWVKNKRTRVVVMLKMRVLHRKWEMADYQKESLIGVVQQAEMIRVYAPFNWGLSFTAVPIPIKMPSCIVRILSCELRMYQIWAVIAHQ